MSAYKNNAFASNLKRIRQSAAEPVNLTPESMQELADLVVKKILQQAGRK